MKQKQFTIKMPVDAIDEFYRIHESSENTNMGITLAEIIMKHSKPEEDSEETPTENQWLSLAGSIIGAYSKAVKEARQEPERKPLSITINF